jgi:hypothetical protein
MTTDFLEIEDDILLLEASAGVLHLAFRSLDNSGKGHSALAQTIWLAAKTIEDACQRIRQLEPGAGPRCACRVEEEPAQ